MNVKYFKGLDKQVGSNIFMVSIPLRELKEPAFFIAVNSRHLFYPSASV